MAGLKQFLEDAGSSAKLAAEYAHNPDEVIKRRRLPEEDHEAIKRKDTDTVRRLSRLREVHLMNSTINSHD